MEVAPVEVAVRDRDDAWLEDVSDQGEEVRSEAAREDVPAEASGDLVDPVQPVSEEDLICGDWAGSPEDQDCSNTTTTHEVGGRGPPMYPHPL